MTGEPIGDQIYFKLKFLEAMVPVMTEPDVDILRNICEHFLDQTAVLADLNLLDQLYSKFEKEK